MAFADNGPGNCQARCVQARLDEKGGPPPPVLHFCILSFLLRHSVVFVVVVVWSGMSETRTLACHRLITPASPEWRRCKKTKTKRNIAPWNDNWSLCWTDLLCTHMYRAPANGILLRCRRKCDELLLCRNWNENNKKPFARNKYSDLFAKEIACGLNCVWNTKPAARLRLHKTISKC